MLEDSLVNDAGCKTLDGYIVKNRCENLRKSLKPSHVADYPRPMQLKQTTIAWLKIIECSSIITPAAIKAAAPSN